MGLKSGVFSLLLLVCGYSQAQISFDLMHTRPECAETSLLYNKASGTFCAKTDQKMLAALAGMEDKVKDLISLAQDKETAEINIAYFSFSNYAVKDALCEKAKQGFKINAFFDDDYEGPGQLPDQLNNCEVPTLDNVKTYFLGKQSGGIWRLHHNKFLMINPGKNEPVSVNFSSGNLSVFGLSAHFDHWVTMMADPNTSLVKSHICVVGALKLAAGAADGGTSDDPVLFRKTLDHCLYQNGTISSVSEALEKEKIAPLFAPTPTDALYKELVIQISQVNPGGKIYGAMQHFLHKGIVAALGEAVKRGVEVSLLMDDDIITGQGEVPGVLNFYRYSILAAGIKVRFMQTNAMDRQMMHNKFIIMENVGINNVNRVFSGAGHFTNAGMRNNYENFYISQVDTLTAKYQDLYQYMFKSSLSESEAAQ